MAVIACPHCSKSLVAPAELAGRKAKCGKCGKSFMIEFLTEPISFPTFQLPKDPEDSDPAESSVTDLEIDMDRGRTG
jgi:hypothetical protein